jgi:hypothetical protein
METLVAELNFAAAGLATHEMAAKTKFPIKFIGWQANATSETVGTPDAIVIIEELRGMLSNTQSFMRITTWDSPSPIPFGMTANPGDVK